MREKVTGAARTPAHRPTAATKFVSVRSWALREETATSLVGGGKKSMAKRKSLAQACVCVRVRTRDDVAFAVIIRADVLARDTAPPNFAALFRSRV